MVEEKRQLHAAAGDEKGVGDSLHTAWDHRDGRRTVRRRARALRAEQVDSRAIRRRRAACSRRSTISGCSRWIKVTMAALGRSSNRRWRWRRRPVRSSRRPTACATSLSPNLGRGQFDQARNHFERSLASAARLGWKENVAYCLVGFGARCRCRGRARPGWTLPRTGGTLVEDLHLNLETLRGSGAGHGGG